MCDEISVKVSKYDGSPNSSQESRTLDVDRRIDGRDKFDSHFSQPLCEKRP